MNGWAFFATQPKLRGVSSTAGNEHLSGIQEFFHGHWTEKNTDNSTNDAGEKPEGHIPKQSQDNNLMLTYSP
jgi:hypothetical protein